MSEEKTKICKINQSISPKEKKALNRLWEYQSNEIEHKEPKNPLQFYYTEAIGDIFRDLTEEGKGWYSNNYINEKLKKLDNFGSEVGQDQLQMCKHYIKNETEMFKEVNALDNTNL